MCVAMPGKVLTVNENVATVDFSGNIVEAQADLVTVEPGDYVLVHAGFILQKLSQEEGDTLAELFKELKAYD